MDKTGREFSAVLNACREKMLASGSVETLRQLLDRMKKYYGGRRQFAEKTKNGTVYYTTDTFYDDVRAVGQMLLSLGGNVHAAVVGENSYNWLTAFFAAAASGNVAVPIDKELPDDKIAILAEKADCRVMFFSASYSGAAERFVEGGGGRLAVCIGGNARNIKCADIDGVKASVTDFSDFDRAEPKKDDVAAIIFTSGTTGANKGVMLTHGNFCSDFTGLAHAIKPINTAMSVLPMNHVYELSCVDMTAIYVNALLYINDSLRHLERNLREFRPEAMAAVPALLDSLCNGIVMRAREEGKLKKLLRGVKISDFLMKFGIDIRRFLFADVTERFGCNFPAIAVGGSPVNGEKTSFLASLGFDIYVGYGLTETSPIVTLNRDVRRMPNSVGKCLPCCEIRIASPDEDGVGEIEVRGKNVAKGYYGDADADSRSFDDEWFRTGDCGYLGRHGELYITGRKKNIIILDNGKNIYTEELESHFTQNSDIIEEAVVFPSEKETPSGRVKYLAMAVSVGEKASRGKTHGELSKEVGAEVARLNASLPSYEKISDVMTLTGGFKKTSTMKIIRTEAEKAYNEYKMKGERNYG